MMACGEMDMLMHPYLDGELVAEERVLVEKHVHACARCRELLHHEVTFRQNLRTRLRPRVDDLAPATLRQNVLAALDRADAKGEGPSRPFLRKLAPAFGAMVTAAAAILFLAIGAHDKVLPGGEAIIQQAIDGHRKNLPVEIGGTDEEIARWFGGKVPVAVRLPRMEAAPRVRLVGARLYHLASRDAGQVVYTMGRSQVTVYVFDPSGWEVSAPIHRRIDGRDVYFDERSGYSVAVYRDRGVGYAVASDLDEEKLASLVQAALRE